jgi:predicted transcriptional regulator
MGSTKKLTETNGNSIIGVLIRGNMGKAITREEYKTAQDILKIATNDKEAVELSGLSESTMRRIKRSKSYKDFRVISAGDSETYRYYTVNPMYYEDMPIKPPRIEVKVNWRVYAEKVLRLAYGVLRKDKAQELQ